MTKQIAIYFGHALLGNPRHQEIEDRAIEWGCSIDFAILEDFDWLFRKTHNVHENQELFNQLFTLVSKSHVIAPSVEVKFGSDNISKVPTLVLNSNHLRVCETEEEIEITDEMVNQLGLEIEAFFGFEFLDFKRISSNESWVYGE